jgi:hypothetical protein
MKLSKSSEPLAFTLQMFDLVKSRFESPEFLQEFEEIQKSVCQNGAGMPPLNALITASTAQFI